MRRLDVGRGALAHVVGTCVAGACFVLEHVLGRCFVGMLVGDGSQLDLDLDLGSGRAGRRVGVCHPAKQHLQPARQTGGQQGVGVQPGQRGLRRRARVHPLTGEGLEEHQRECVDVDGRRRPTTGDLLGGEEVGRRPNGEAGRRVAVVDVQQPGDPEV